MKKTITFAAAILGAALTLSAQPLDAGKLDRGFAGVKTADGYHLSWRMLPSDKSGAGFEIWRSTDGGKAVKVSDKSIKTTSDFIDTSADLSKKNVWTLKASGKEMGSWSVDAGKAESYLEIPINKPEARNLFRITQRSYGTSDSYNPGDEGDAYSYTAGDCSVADLDGDGQLEIILKWDPSNASTPEQTGVTGNTLLDAYKLDGTQLWRIDLGHNVRSTYASVPFVVYDLDGDGCAELVVKTADGTVDGTGQTLGNPRADWRSMDEASETFGRAVIGPEYLTVFDGRSGKKVDSEKFIPIRFPLDSWGGIGENDNIGIRSEKYTAGVAYLDGKTPSVFFVRGADARTVVAAWKYDGQKLTSQWTFDSKKDGLGAYSGNGNPNVAVADFDGDGADEICVGAMIVNNDGSGLLTTKLRGGIALHAGALVPSRGGIQVFGTHDNSGVIGAFLENPAMAMFDGKSGEILWSKGVGETVGRGVAADIDPRYPGAEVWIGSVDPSGRGGRGGGMMMPMMPQGGQPGGMPGGAPQGQPGQPAGQMPQGGQPGGPQGAPQGGAPQGGQPGQQPGAPQGMPGGPQGGQPGMQGGPMGGGPRVMMSMTQSLPEYNGPLKGVYNGETGELISSAAPSSCNFTIYWDADPQAELLDGTKISKWNWQNERTETLLEAKGVKSIDGTKAVPCFSGDILGDWREEVIWVDSNEGTLRIYMTPYAATNRMTTLLCDRQYRLSLVWQNVGYNQPPHTSFDMESNFKK